MLWGSAGQSRRVAGLVFVIAATLALAGCSSSGGTSPTPPAGSSTPLSSAAGSHGSTSATASGDFCSRFTTTEIGAIVIASVSAGTDAAGRCTFTSPGASATLKELPPTAAANGGYAGAKAGASAGIKGTSHDISGLGDSAFVDSGTAAGTPIAEGAVQINGQVIEATINNPDSTPSVLDSQLEALLRLASTRA